MLEIGLFITEESLFVLAMMLWFLSLNHAPILNFHTTMSLFVPLLLC